VVHPLRVTELSGKTVLSLGVARLVLVIVVLRLSCTYSVEATRAFLLLKQGSHHTVYQVKSNDTRRFFIGLLRVGNHHVQGFMQLDPDRKPVTIVTIGNVVNRLG